MGKITYLPETKDKIDVITVSKDKILVNGVEYEAMDLEEFLNNIELSQEAEERFIRGLLQLIKEECLSNWKFMKIFREIFRGRR